MQLLSALNHDDYLALLTECDLGLISLDRKLTTHNVPGKLLGYLEAGLPVLASINEGNDLGTILEQPDLAASHFHSTINNFAAVNVLLNRDGSRTQFHWPAAERDLDIFDQRID